MQQRGQRRYRALGILSCGSLVVLVLFLVRQWWLGTEQSQHVPPQDPNRALHIHLCEIYSDLILLGRGYYSLFTYLDLTPDQQQCCLRAIYSTFLDSSTLPQQRHICRDIVLRAATDLVGQVTAQRQRGQVDELRTIAAVSAALLDWQEARYYFDAFLPVVNKGEDAVREVCRRGAV